MQDLTLIQQLLPSFPLEVIFNPKLPPPIDFPLKPGISYEDNKKELAKNKWHEIVEPENNTPPATVITAGHLAKICPRLHIDRAKEICAHFDTILPRYGMAHIDYLEEFIPNVAVECAEFTRFEESLSYSANRLLEVFPKYYKSKELAVKEQYRPEKIANRVYGGRMGNTAPGDGYENRGSGAMMLTGKAVMLMYGKHKGIDPEKVPNLLRTNIEFALDSACWFFAVYKSLKDEALADKFLAICKAINGGTNGLNERKYYHDRLLDIFK